MKKSILCFFCITFCFFQVFAKSYFLNTLNCSPFEPKMEKLLSEDNWNGIKESMNNFASTANSEGSGEGYFGLEYDPFGFNTLLLVANFKIIGVWGTEISFGKNFSKGAFAFEIDPLNLTWQIPLGESTAWTIGAGFPICFTIGTDFPENGYDIFGIRPTVDFRFHFFADKDYGLSFFVRPGYLIDFEHSENNKFSCNLGIMCRMPSSFIAQAFANL